MAYFALTTKEQSSNRWRTCAIFPAGDRTRAAVYAKSLRDSQSLGFVQHPANFRLRNASRNEISLLTNYLNSVDNSTFPTFQGDYLENLLNRRRKLMSSFFLGLFLQPEVMKKLYGSKPGGASRLPKNTSTGGAEQDNMDQNSSDEPQDTSDLLVAEDTYEEADIVGSDTGDANDANASSGPLTDSSEQEMALQALLSTPEATESARDSDEMDLDFL